MQSGPNKTTQLKFSEELCRELREILTVVFHFAFHRVV